jgi:hypothetical protein
LSVFDAGLQLLFPSLQIALLVVEFQLACMNCSLPSLDFLVAFVELLLDTKDVLDPMTEIWQVR